MPLLSFSAYWQPVKECLLKLAATAFLLPVFSSSLFAASLVLTDITGNLVFSHAVKNGDTFAIRYIHSVALTPVIDYFKIQNNEIWLDRTEYEDFGAGLPHTAEKQQKMQLQHGKLILSGYNRRLPEFELRVGRVARHELLIEPHAAKGNQPVFSRSISLSDLTTPGSVLKFAIK